MNQAKENLSGCKLPDDNRIGQKGFSLVEVTIAMVIFLIVLLGVFVTFTYAITYNAGNNSRAQGLAVLQQEVELLRSAKFTSGITDSSLSGGKKAARIVTSADNSRFRVEITIDDEPETKNIIEVDATKKMKEITVKVTLDNPTPGWQTSLPAIVVLQRVRGN